MPRFSMVALRLYGFLLMLGVPATARAAESGEAEAAPNILEFKPSLAIATIIVFTLLLLVLWRFAWGPLAKALHDREERMRLTAEEAERARDEAQQLMLQHRAMIEQAGEQVRAILDEGRRTAQATGDEIVKKAQSEADASRQRAERDITTARDQALQEILVADREPGRRSGGQGARPRAARRRPPPADRHRDGRAARGAERPGGTRLMTPDAAGTVFDETQTQLARTYADALLGAAARDGQEAAVLDELDELVADVWMDHPDFAVLLESPALAAAEKDRILVDTFAGRTLPLLLTFLRVLNRNGRLAILRLVAREARAAWDRRQNRRHVQVRSAVPLDEGQLAALRDRLATLLRATPVLHTHVDPALIGGLVLQVDDHVYDASVRTGYLERFRRQLIDQKTHEILARFQTFSTT